MAILCRWVLVVLVFFAVGPRLLLAAPTEKSAFDSACLDLSGTFYERAERGFSEFIRTYTNSSRLPEAFLYQAQARFKQAKYRGAIELLSANQARAGNLADEYLFWLGEAYLQNGSFAEARNAFGNLLQQFPGATNALQAAVDQATACSRMEDWPRVVELLQNSNGVFQAAIRTNAASELLPRGYLLLGEAQLALPQPDYKAAENTLQPLAKLTLDPRLNWKRQHLLCRIQLASNRPEEALQNTTNLLALAAAAAQPDLQAESIAFRASLLERFHRLNEAIATYTNNLPEGVPVERQRQALLKITELHLAQNQIPQAAAKLEEFVAKNPNAPASDLALLALGELRLRECVSALGTNLLFTAPTNSPALTNCLPKAIATLQELTGKFPNSALIGKAQLDLGWCFWLDGKLTECRTNFQAAIQRLPASVDQATACFKLADVQFRQGDFAGALVNYSAVIDKFADLPEVSTNLFEPALHQSVQAGLAAGNLSAATNATAKLMKLFPNSSHTARSVLLAGQALSRQGNLTSARSLFREFINAASNAPLLPQVHLALARTFEVETNWTDAIKQYNLLLACCTNQEAQALGEYYRARATAQAGQDTNALVLFTNFLAHFPPNQHTPLAQLWVADYYFQVRNYRDAELSYQPLFENKTWAKSQLAYDAMMMAGRAAAAQQLWNNAIYYFTNLAGNPNCPPDLWVQAMFAYGDSLISQLNPNLADANNLNNLKTAINVFSSIYERHPTNPQAVLALGAKANALIQLAQYSHQPEYLTNAASAYQQVLTNLSSADAAARSIAKVGSGLVLERLAEQQSGAEQTALLKQALDQYLDVFHGTIVGDEKADLFWTKQAGESAGRLAESLQEWSQAVDIYERLQQLLPSLRTRFQEKLQVLKARERLASGKN